MEEKSMKITYFDYIRTIVPNGSCGTGYSEPDEFEVGYETEKEESFETIHIDIWYRPDKTIKNEFITSIKHFFGEVDNIEDAFEMYVEQITKNNLCPYTFEEIMNANNF